LPRSFGPTSIRWRLQLWVAILLTGVLTGFGFTVYQLERIKRFNQIDGELEARVSVLNRALRDAPFTRGPAGVPPEMDAPPRGPEPRLERKPDSIALPVEAPSLFQSYYYAIWYRDSSLIQRSPGLPYEGDSPSDLDRDTLTHYRTRQDYREAFHCSGFGDCVLTGRSIRADLAGMTNFALILLAAGSSVLALGLTVGWRIATSVIRPIEQISAAANRISQGNLNERIALPNRADELGALAGVLNRTFARLESAFSRQRQFTADAAHELRTPLAILISETQTTLARERTAAEYRETVEGCLDTAQQMRGLTDSLLELARFDSEAVQLPRAQLDLAELTQTCLERIAPLAEQSGVRLHATLTPSPVFSAGEPLRQVIGNLLTNAIRYNKPNGEVRISTQADSSAAILSITDTGIGIPSADLPFIFDRFYRVDKARSRRQGSTGLGLAICKAIVDAERGRIDVASIPGEGTTFTVRLPKSAPTIATQ
jgi:two-component system, OmpR family, sensor kinase